MTATTIPIIAADRAKNVRMRFRKGEGKVITFNFLEDSNAYNISGFIFVLQVFAIDGTSPLFALTEGEGLVNNGATGALVATVTDDQVDLDPKTYVWKLRIISPYKFTCFDALFAINDSPITDDEELTDITVPISLGDIVVNINLTLTQIDLQQVLDALNQLPGAQEGFLLYFNGTTWEAKSPF